MSLLLSLEIELQSKTVEGAWVWGMTCAPWPFFPCSAQTFAALHPSEPLAQEASAKRCGPVMEEWAPSQGFPPNQTRHGSVTERMGKKKSCHCKVEVPLLPQYYHRNMLWDFIFPTLSLHSLLLSELTIPLYSPGSTVTGFGMRFPLRGVLCPWFSETQQVSVSYTCLALLGSN